MYINLTLIYQSLGMYINLTLVYQSPRAMDDCETLAAAEKQRTEKLERQLSRLEEKEMTLAYLIDERIPPGSLPSEVEEIKGEIEEVSAEIRRAAKEATASETVEALIQRANGIVNGVPAAGGVIGADEDWFMCLLAVVRLVPGRASEVGSGSGYSYSTSDVRNIAWSLLKHAVIPVNRSISDQIQRLEIDWEGDLFLTVYELHVVNQVSACYSDLSIARHVYQSSLCVLFARC